MRWRKLGKGPPAVKRNGAVIYPVKPALKWIRQTGWTRPSHPVEDDAQMALSPRERLALLTPRQREVHEYICRRFRATGQSPTFEEMRRAFGFRSPNAATCVVKGLIRKKVLARQPGSPTHGGRRVGRGLTPTVFPRGV